MADLVTEGTWRAIAREAALGFTSKGGDQLGVDMELLEGPSKGRRITWYGYFTDAAFDRTIESMRLLGWQGTDLSVLAGIGDHEVMLVVGHEPDQKTGELRARAQWVNPIGGVAIKDRMDAAAAKVFAARMRGRVLALGTPQPQRPTPARAPANAAPTNEAGADDNIPF